MTDFPSAFPELYDRGGHGQGQPLSGFGGNPAENQAHHQDFVRASGKSPLVLVHGNTGTATHAQWGWLKVIQYLKLNFGYADEHFWALSYLGTGQRQLADPYTQNIDDLRIFADTVRQYLDVECIDMVGHSMGCHLILCYLAGLKKQGSPIAWDAGFRYADVGSVVLIDGAMRGLSTILPHYDEWLPDHEVYQCLSPDNTPHGHLDAMTSAPEHNLKYWCCMVPGGFVDAMDMNRGTTGHLDGADANRFYNTGPGHTGHEIVKDDPAIIRDWAPYLNAKPPCDPVTINVDKESGTHAADLQVRVSVDPPGVPVDYLAKRITRQIVVGVLETEISATLEGRLDHGQSLTLAEEGAWEVTFEAPCASPVSRIYGVGVALPQVEITTDNSVDFENRLEVMARSDSGIVYLNIGDSAEAGWERRASVTITTNTEVKAMAVTADGLASEIVTKTFIKAVTWTEQAIGTVTEHYVAGRLDINAYLQFGSKYGYVQAFTLYRIDDQWTDDPERTTHDTEMPVLSCSHDSGIYTHALTVELSAVDAADPAPRIYYTTDDTTPTTGSDFFINKGTVSFNMHGKQTLKYSAQDRSGNATPIETRTFELEFQNQLPVIVPSQAPGTYHQAITLEIKGHDHAGAPLTVYYSLDGSVPDENSAFFNGPKLFTLNGNGNHAISCFAKDAIGNEKREVFYYTIHDEVPPQTTIYPNGGDFIGDVEIFLNTEEPVAWIKYTTDGSEPDETNGTLYTGTFRLSETTTIRYRSKDIQGNLEDTKAASFSRQTGYLHAVFDNMAAPDGYIKANPDGTSRSVVSSFQLAIGAGWDGRISRAILSFDTSSLPQSARISHAALQVKHLTSSGDPWQGRQLNIDVKTGKFGTSSTCQISDWDDEATAAAVAAIEPFDMGRKESSPFSEAGTNAINRSGRTQMRLYFEPHIDMESYSYLFLSNGADAKLIVDYTDT